MSNLYSGMKERVKQLIIDGLSVSEMYDIVVEEFDYSSKKRSFKRYVQKLKKFMKNEHDEVDNTIHYVDPEVSEYMDKISQDFNGNKGVVNVNSLTICTVDQALEVAQVDLNIWTPDRHVINSWGVTMKGPDGMPVYRTNYQVKVWLSQKSSALTAQKEAIDGLIKTLPLALPIIPSSTLHSNDEIALEISNYDAHFGKFAWGDETLQGHWDMEICAKAYIDSVLLSIERSTPFKPNKIFFVVGQDLFHSENYAAVTPKSGHRLDADARLPKIIQKGREMMIRAIDICRTVAPTEIIWIPGNHDMHSSLWMCHILDAHYRSDPYVTVDLAPSIYKAKLWGNLLVGFTHDGSGAMQNRGAFSMPVLWSEMWGQSKYREMHVGHKHKKAITKFGMADTVGSIIFRQIPSLGVADFWTAENMFNDAVPAGEALLWDKGSGVIAHFTNNIKPTF